MTIKKIKDSNGQEHGIDYEALENLPAIAGEPIYLTNYSILHEEHCNASLIPTANLSNYLPNDGECYKVTFKAWCYALKGDQAVVRVRSDMEDVEPSMVNCIDSRRDLTVVFDVIVGPSRTITLRAHTAGNYDCYTTLTMLRYQKVNAVKV